MNKNCQIILTILGVVLIGHPERYCSADMILDEAFNKARKIIRSWKPDIGSSPRKYTRERRVERPRKPPPSRSSPQDEDEARRKIGQQRENERVRNNLRSLEAHLAKASVRTPDQTPTDPDAKSAIQNRQSSLNFVLSTASKQYEIQQDPITNRGAYIEKLMMSYRAQQIHDAILNNTPLKIQIEESSEEQSYPAPWYHLFVKISFTFAFILKTLFGKELSDRFYKR